MKRERRLLIQRAYNLNTKARHKSRVKTEAQGEEEMELMSYSRSVTEPEIELSSAHSSVLSTKPAGSHLTKTGNGGEE